VDNDPAHGFPMRNDVANGLKQLTGGIPAGAQQTWYRKTKFYHRLDVKADGSQLSFTFFNEARAKFITNLDQPNTISSNYAFAASAIRFNFLYGFDRLQFRLGIQTTTPTAAQFKASSMNFGEAAATITDNEAQLWKIQEKIRELLSNGVVTMTVGEKPVVEAFALTSFPSGTGIVTANALSHTMTAAAASNSIQNGMTSAVNGVPVLSNVFSLGQQPYPIAPGQTFNLKVEFNRGIDWTETNLGPLSGVATTGTPDGVLKAGVLECDLEGTLISPA